MKILIFSWRDIKNPQAGGAEILTLELAKRWAKDGHQTALVTAKFPGAKEEETIDKVKIFRPAVFFAQTPRAYLNYLYQTAKFYQKNLADKYDLIIDQAHGLPLFTPFYARQKIVLFPLEVAKEIWFREVCLPFSLIGYFLEQAYIRFFRHLPFLTISSSTAKELKMMGVKNVFTITPGVNPKPLSKLPRKNKFPRLVSLGRITPMKRIEDTIQALRLLHKEFPIIKLVVIGHGQPKYLEKLKNLCQNMAIEDRVSFTGFVSEKEKRRLLRQARILVSSSLKEGWGLTVIEAAACGTPTVAYQIPGLVDSVKNQETGLLCQKNTPVELARNIRKVLIDPSLRKRLSQNALNYSQNFSWDKTAREGLTILEKIISS